MTSSGYSMDTPQPALDLFNIISVQSSSRPGCIIELEAFTDAQQVCYGRHSTEDKHLSILCKHFVNIFLLLLWQFGDLVLSYGNPKDWYTKNKLDL